MKTNRKKYIAGILMAICLLLMTGKQSMAQFTESYLYNLSSFTGVVPYSWATLSCDEWQNEVYVVYQNLVTVFNENGMEVHSFGDSLDIGHILDVAVEENGDILLLAYNDLKSSVTRSNYRGEPKEEIKLKDLPEEFAKMHANRIAYRDGKIYLASEAQMQIVVVDATGRFVKGFDLITIFGLEEKDRTDAGFSGFNLDKNGNMLFTVPVLFTANILSPDGEIVSFGKPGGAPGKFNIVVGIVADSQGNYLVADKLKSAIIVFDKDLNFIKEFGYRGEKPGNLIAPESLTIDSEDRLYVSQGRKKGVSVFKLIHE
ncbi:MAG: hypothetical protein KKA54_19970 [Proteobacteria bacterium]|nr:hypothetical protein [Pseudomonadota bacterium]MBU0968647.1 hypothetical protein [Pseudomonadota bacterium]